MRRLLFTLSLISAQSASAHGLEHWLALQNESLLQAETERSALASEDGFVAAMLDTLKQDAIYLVPQQNIIEGRGDIADYLLTEDPTQTRLATFDPRRVKVSADGQLGFSFGWNVFTRFAEDGTPITSYGKYTSVWKRVGQHWRVVAHCQNATAFTPSPAPASYPFFDAEPPHFRFAPARINGEEVAAADTAFAADSVARGSAVAFPAFADEDAVEVGGPIYYGLQAIIDLHQFDLITDVLNWGPVVSRSTLSGDLGWSVGTYVFDFDDGTGNRSFAYGKYLTVWERQEDLSWKWSVDQGNPSPPPAP